MKENLGATTQAIYEGNSSGNIKVSIKVPLAHEAKISGRVTWEIFQEIKRALMQGIKAELIDIKFMIPCGRNKFKSAQYQLTKINPSILFSPSINKDNFDSLEIEPAFQIAPVNSRSILKHYNRAEGFVSTTAVPSNINVQIVGMSIEEAKQNLDNLKMDVASREEANKFALKHNPASQEEEVIAFTSPDYKKDGSNIITKKPLYIEEDGKIIVGGSSWRKQEGRTYLVTQTRLYTLLHSVQLAIRKNPEKNYNDFLIDFNGEFRAKITEETFDELRSKKIGNKLSFENIKLILDQPVSLDKYRLLSNLTSALPDKKVYTTLGEKYDFCFTKELIDNLEFELPLKSKQQQDKMIITERYFDHLILGAFLIARGAPSKTSEEIAIKIADNVHGYLSASSMEHLKRSKNFEDVNLSQIEIEIDAPLTKSIKRRVGIKGTNIILESCLRNNFTFKEHPLKRELSQKISLTEAKIIKVSGQKQALDSVLQYAEENFDNPAKLVMSITKGADLATKSYISAQDLYSKTNRCVLGEISNFINNYPDVECKYFVVLIEGMLPVKLTPATFNYLKKVKDITQIELNNIELESLIKISNDGKITDTDISLDPTIIDNFRNIGNHSTILKATKIEAINLSEVEPKQILHTINTRTGADNLIAEQAMWQIIEEVKIALNKGINPGAISIVIADQEGKQGNFKIGKIDANFITQANDHDLNSNNFYSYDLFYRNSYIKLVAMDQNAAELRAYSEFEKFISNKSVNENSSREERAARLKNLVTKPQVLDKGKDKEVGAVELAKAVELADSWDINSGASTPQIEDLGITLADLNDLSDYLNHELANQVEDQPVDKNKEMMNLVDRELHALLDELAKDRPVLEESASNDSMKMTVSTADLDTLIAELEAKYPHIVGKNREQSEMPILGKFTRRYLVGESSKEESKASSVNG